VLQLGRAGVLLFFVHTAFVLLLSLERQQSASAGNLWRRFMTRRVFRIHPLAMLAVAMYTALKIPELRSPFPRISVADVTANLLLIQNVTWSHSVPQVLWSLPYEVQMYCVLPFVYLAIKRDRSRTAGKLVVLAAAWVFLWDKYYLLPFSVSPKFLSLLEFVPCFLMGAVAYSVSRSHRLTAALWPLFVCAAVIVYAATVSGHYIWYEWPLCAAIGIALPHFRELPANMASTVAGYIARYSYGIYLFHGAVMWFVFKVLGLVSLIGICACCIFTGLAAMAAYYGIERPMMQLGNRIASARPTRSLQKAFSDAAKH
jgi:peptidoglycan/LPS O-acetylase OafA/YrhL